MHQTLVQKRSDKFSKQTSIATPPAPYRSLPGPPGPESRKSLKRVSRGLPAPGSKKCPKQSRNRVSKQSILRLRRLFRDCFGDPRGRKAPGDSFETLSGFRARRAQETPVTGGRGCKTSAKTSSFSKVKKTCHFDTPFVLILLSKWVLQKRYPNGYQNKRVPKRLVFRKSKNLPF